MVHVFIEIGLTTTSYIFSLGGRLLNITKAWTDKIIHHCHALPQTLQMTMHGQDFSCGGSRRKFSASYQVMQHICSQSGNNRIGWTSLKQVNLLNKTDRLVDIPVKMYAHTILNYSQGVVKVERVERREDWPLIPTDCFILIVKTQTISKEIKSCFLNKVYISNPQRCFNCQGFWHILQQNSIMCQLWPRKITTKTVKEIHIVQILMATIPHISDPVSNGKTKSKFYELQLRKIFPFMKQK